MSRVSNYRMSSPSMSTANITNITSLSAQPSDQPSSDRLQFDPLLPSRPLHESIVEASPIFSIMTQPLTSEEEIRYTEIIDGILATADLETVTRKKIRLGLQAELGGRDLNEQRNAIKALIEQRFDAISATAAPASTVVPDVNAPPSPPNGYTNGHDHAVKEELDVNGGEIKVSTQPPKKKPRKEQSTDTEDADAKLAALLQAEENQRTRTTRGGGAKAAPKKKKPAPKKKSDKRIRPEDDSDVDGSEEPSPKKRKAGGGVSETV
ncbi:hypothetical protein EKO27_g6584 [Xylaria grammica]|uniref:DEK-C domain-containing protein n=1 Tax=Xylaria grammica TaxID=363999 RepID=A0A439D2L3_9PEZI|nr:hypothetical protein EKO27_g6584 [Xylaria grammica]